MYVEVISRGGRPAKPVSDEYLLGLLNDRKTLTIKQMAAKYGLSDSTIARHIRMAKDRAAVDFQ